MKKTYKTVSVYVDKQNDLIAIPHGESDKYSLAELDIVLALSAPYTDEDLEAFLLEAYGKCYSQKSNDTTNVSPLEKYLNVKGYSKAIKNRRVVLLHWFKENGYEIVPTNKIPRRGYDHIEEKTFKIGKEIKDKNLSNAFKEAMQLSTTD